MNTEITDKTEYLVVKGWVLFDGSCRLCTGLAARCKGILAKRGLKMASLHEAWVREELGRSAGEPLMEMKVLTRHSGVLGGAAALVYLARLIWWGRPLAWLAAIPGVMPILERAYAWYAARRHCSAICCASSGRRLQAGTQ